MIKIEKVTYLYDHGGRLAEVRGKTTVRYAYQDTYLMSIEENGRRVIEFDYDRRGRISELRLPIQGLYRFEYQYDAADTKRVVSSTVTSPDGSNTKFAIAGAVSRTIQSSGGENGRDHSH